MSVAEYNKSEINDLESRFNEFQAEMRQSNTDLLVKVERNNLKLTVATTLIALVLPALITIFPIFVK